MTFIGGSGALGAFVYGFANRMLIPLGLHHIVNSYVWFLYGDYPEAPTGRSSTGEHHRDSPPVTRRAAPSRPASTRF